MLVVVNPLVFDLWLNSVPQLWAGVPPVRQPFLCGLKEMRQTRTHPRPRVVTPEMREKYRAAAKARWADPVTGAKWRAAVSEAIRLFSPASRARLSEATKARWADPASRERLMAGIRASNADPVVGQRKATAVQERWADPAKRDKMIAGITNGKPNSRRRRTIADAVTSSPTAIEKT